MIKTKFDRIDVGIPGVAAFRIEGKLGFHENSKIQRLVEECVKREFRAVIVDFSELASLGGGVAKIFRDFSETIASRGGRVNFVVTNDIIAQFLQDGTALSTLRQQWTTSIDSTDGSVLAVSRCQGIDVWTNPDQNRTSASRGGTKAEQIGRAHV